MSKKIPNPYRAEYTVEPGRLERIEDSLPIVADPNLKAIPHAGDEAIEAMAGHIVHATTVALLGISAAYAIRKLRDDR